MKKEKHTAARQRLWRKIMDEKKKFCLKKEMQLCTKRPEYGRLISAVFCSFVFRLIIILGFIILNDTFLKIFVFKKIHFKCNYMATNNCPFSTTQHGLFNIIFLYI